MVGRAWVWAGVLVAASRSAWASPDGPTWVLVDGDKRVEFVALDLGPPTELPAGAACHAWMVVRDDQVDLRPLPDDADRRLVRRCDPAVLAAAQRTTPDWALRVRAFTPQPTAELPVWVTTQADRRMNLRVVAERYGVSPSAHPAELLVVEEPQLKRTPEPRYPRSARKLVKAGELEPRAVCGAELDLSAEGRVLGARLGACPEPLREAAEKLARGYTFTPRVVNGEAEAHTLSVSMVLSAD